jgi:hypothetical protein
VEGGKKDKLKTELTNKVVAKCQIPRCNSSCAQCSKDLSSSGGREAIYILKRKEVRIPGTFKGVLYQNL